MLASSIKKHEDIMTVPESNQQDVTINVQTALVDGINK